MYVRHGSCLYFFDQDTLWHCFFFTPVLTKGLAETFFRKYQLWIAYKCLELQSLRTDKSACVQKQS